MKVLTEGTPKDDAPTKVSDDSVSRLANLPTFGAFTQESVKVFGPPVLVLQSSHREGGLETPSSEGPGKVEDHRGPQEPTPT